MLVTNLVTLAYTSDWSQKSLSLKIKLRLCFISRSRQDSNL
ncbi:hypothetical protein VIBNISOn1_1180015 [Vibrio nigripulchritudo SOn1]|uniref:Uncharacterized protein n=1 Tax=Vibrio nigripulchritudo SOn1 TaxID=1238450 RepID=A0AAV2VJR4_9VIBR|nr:hypothetical protein VIBNISOn1_1180015 [Vibrio nigripulchritudo SOn1]